MTAATMTRTTNRREHRRFPLVCDVWQRQDSGPSDAMACRIGGLAGRTLNLSDGGALVQVTELPDGTIHRPRPGQDIALTLALPRTTADTFLIEHVRLTGQVVRVHGHCEEACSAFAIQFDRPVHLDLD
ncbi:MAG: hypothetical protein BIFFINMI_01451 [Phycisphaerae bacterium]|nr:hypothetical protein [Phycisphaerae bacterium]